MRLVELQEDEPLRGCVVYVVGKGSVGSRNKVQW